MNAPVHAKAYCLPLRSKLLAWLEANPQQAAPAEQWQGMLNNLQSMRREEIERAIFADNYIYPDQRITKYELIDELKSNLAACRNSSAKFRLQAMPARRNISEFQRRLRRAT